MESRAVTQSSQQSLKERILGASKIAALTIAAIYFLEKAIDTACAAPAFTKRCFQITVGLIGLSEIMDLTQDKSDDR